MELIDGAVAQQVDDHPRGDRIDVRRGRGRLDRSIQLSISKKRMKLDFPEPLDPIKMLVAPKFESSTSARDLNPQIRTDSSLVVAVIKGHS